MDYFILFFLKNLAQNHATLCFGYGEKFCLLFRLWEEGFMQSTLMELVRKLANFDVCTILSYEHCMLALLIKSLLC